MPDSVEEALRRARQYRENLVAEERQRAELLRRAEEVQALDQKLSEQDSRQFRGEPETEPTHDGEFQDYLSRPMRWKVVAQEVTQRRDSGDNDKDTPNGDNQGGPHRPDPQLNARDKQFARTNADYERLQREAVEEQRRSDERAEYMQEHHPEEHSAEEARKANRTEREASTRGIERSRGEQQEERQPDVRAERSGMPEPQRQEGPAREIHDRALEKRDKDQQQEAKRRAGLDWYMQKRAKDRARDRDGGRDR